MAKLNLPAIWHDIKTYRRAYTLTAIASFGGMLFVRPPPQTPIHPIHPI